MELVLHPVYFPNVSTLRCLLEPAVWEVWDNFQKQTFRNRCYICTDRGRHMLNIPIRHVGGKTGRQRYRDVRIDNTYPWQRQHWRSLETAYRSAPFFEYYEPELAPLFEKRHEWLMEWNLETTAILCRLAGLPFPESKTERYEAVPEGNRDMRPLVNAKTATEAGFPPYPQVFMERTGFVPNLSGLDLLFNEGNQAGAYIRARALPKPANR